MNTNQIKGAVKEAAGKVQEKAGDAVGSTNQQIKGLEKQAEGKVQKKIGDVQQAVKGADKH